MCSHVLLLSLCSWEEIPKWGIGTHKEEALRKEDMVSRGENVDGVEGTKVLERRKWRLFIVKWGLSVTQ